MSTNVTLIRGDGIGPEISDATLRILKHAGADLTFDEQLAGLTAVEKAKNPLPQATIDSIEKTRLALKGPLATPKGEGYRSVNVALRQHFDLYANVRPVHTLAGVPSRYTDIDLCVVRENTEDIYAGIEHYVGPGRMAAESIAVITRHGSERIVRWAFEYARREKRKRVSLVHKANILKFSNGLFLDVGREVAKEYSDIAFDDIIVDACAMALVKAPEKIDIIVTTNLFGDILSDSLLGARRRFGRRARRQHRQGRRHLRGRSRHGARHRRPRAGQPDGADAGRRAAARARRAARAGGAHPQGRDRGARQRRRAHARLGRPSGHEDVHRRRPASHRRRLVLARADAEAPAIAAAFGFVLPRSPDVRAGDAAFTLVSRDRRILAPSPAIVAANAHRRKPTSPAAEGV